MGNEASLEGGEGVLAGLPEGLAPDGKGGFIRTSTGAQVDLSQLSEDDRKQLAAAMSRAQTNKPGGAPARRQDFTGIFVHFKMSTPLCTPSFNRPTHEREGKACVCRVLIWQSTAACQPCITMNAQERRMHVHTHSHLPWE